MTSVSSSARDDMAVHPGECELIVQASIRKATVPATHSGEADREANSGCRGSQHRSTSAGTTVWLMLISRGSVCASWRWLFQEP